jgi:hypothetical protein
MKNKEEGTFQKQLEQCKLKSYHDALKNIKELPDKIRRARIMTENHASQSTTYTQKTLVHSSIRNNVYVVKTLAAFYTS